jgi:hypothetical protein
VAEHVGQPAGKIARWRTARLCGDYLDAEATVLDATAVLDEL